MPERGISLFIYLCLASVQSPEDGNVTKNSIVCLCKPGYIRPASVTVTKITFYIYPF